MQALRVLAGAMILSTALSCSASAVKKAEQARTTNADAMVEAIAKGQLKTVKKMIASGQSIDAVSNEDETGLMKVSEDGDRMTAEQLLKIGADLNKANSNGETAIWYAVYGGHEDLALFFLEKGAKVDAVRSDSKDCLVHYAAKAQLFKLASRLKKLTPKCLSQKNIDGKTPADIARGFGDTKLAAELTPSTKVSK